MIGVYQLAEIVGDLTDDPISGLESRTVHF
jgi:hypothetical protein